MMLHFSNLPNRFTSDDLSKILKHSGDFSITKIAEGSNKFKSALVDFKNNQEAIKVMRNFNGKIYFENKISVAEFRNVDISTENKAWKSPSSWDKIKTFGFNSGIVREKRSLKDLEALGIEQDPNQNTEGI